MATRASLGLPEDFSLVLGGPVYQLWRRLMLSGPALELVGRRMVGIPVVAWLPLVILSASPGACRRPRRQGAVPLRYRRARFVVRQLLLVLGPPCVFMKRLLELKRQGRREYGVLAARYTFEFDEKWIDGKAPAGGPLLGSADIQSLADLGNSYTIVNELKPAR